MLETNTLAVNIVKTDDTPKTETECHRSKAST